MDIRLRRRKKIPPKTKEKTRKSCKACGEPLSRDKNHVCSQSSEQVTGGYTPCLYCGTSMPPDILRLRLAGKCYVKRKQEAAFEEEAGAVQ